MIDILFSHSYYYPLDSKQWEIKNPFPPLGTIYAAAFMRKNGYTVDLFDTNLLDNSYAIKEKIIEKKPKFLVLFDDGFNYLTKMCLTNMREAAFEMIKIGKKNNCIVIINSSDSTDHYEKYLSQGADYIIQGEGEQTLKKLIDTLNEGGASKKIPGIVFKEKSDTIINPKGIVLKDLDELPMPAWDLIAIDEYKKVWKESGSEFTLNIATTRGCPYKCNWCAKPIYGKRYNSHSPKFIVEHIKYLSDNFGTSRFWMCDDIFGLKPNWVQQFRDELKKEKLNINYYIQSRVDLLLEEDNIQALADSGLEEVWVGAESGSQKILDAMDKQTQVEQIYEATRILKEKNIRVAFFIQYGYLNETKDDISKTIKMITELLPDKIGISVSYPLPGTKFYDIVKEDLKLKTNWEDSDDLAMMFQGTFNSKYYRKLYEYTHKEYKKSLVSNNIKQISKNPLKLFSFSKLKSVLSYFYYAPIALLYNMQLKNMQNTND